MAMERKRQAAGLDREVPQLGREMDRVWLRAGLPGGRLLRQLARIPRDAVRGDWSGLRARFKAAKFQGFPRRSRKCPVRNHAKIQPRQSA
jgi:hypothetical protein